MNRPTAEETPKLATDTLSDGIALLLGFTVLQRLVGFVRSILLCRFLADDELGRWSLAFSFLLMAAPLAVLGLTGTFGRYVERYRQRGQLRQFLRRTAAVTMTLGLVTLFVVFVARDWFAWFVFKDSQQTELLALVVITLGALIGFNFFTEVFTALRRPRVAACMEFVSGVVFAIVSLGLVWMYQMGAAAVVIGYTAGCLVASAGALCLLMHSWFQLPTQAVSLPQYELWSKLVPFAAWVWVINLLTNLFDMADRYMIIHFSTLESDQAVSLVGQYHSSLVVPMLMVAVSAMLSNVLLPYLSYDWEAGRRNRVSAQVNLAVKLWGIVLMVGSVCILLGSPLLFRVAYAGKFAAGETVFPLIVSYCVWISLAMVVHNYVWCAERAWLGSAALLVGLATNVLLNWMLLPRFGLVGAVVATSAANAINLGLLYYFSQLFGMKLDARVVLISLIPVAFWMGPMIATGIILIMLWATLRGNWILSNLERSRVEEQLSRYFDQVRAVLNYRGRVKAGV